MKHTRKILVALLVLMTILVSLVAAAIPASAANITTGTRLYLNANYWDTSSARFAAYFFNNSGNAWVDMEDTDSDGIFEVTAPSGTWTNVIFCRMNKGTTANNWDNKWNQTGNLTFDGSNNLFTVSAWDGQTTGWSKMTYYLKGSFNNWGETTPLVWSESSLTASLTLQSGTYTFKIHNGKGTSSTSDDTWWGSNTGINDTVSNKAMSTSDGDCTLNVSKCGTYTFNFANGTLTVTYADADDAHSYNDGVVTTDPSCEGTGIKTFTCSVCNGTKTETVSATGEHTFDGTSDNECNVCGAENPDYVAPSTSTTKTYTFSEYTAGTQYADNEEHVLDDVVTVITTDCHFTTQLRIYSSSTYNGYAIIKSTNPITAISVNAGYKVDTLNVYGSNDEGATWTLIEGISVTSTSYSDYALDLGGNYNYLKLDVAGSNQVRIATMTLTTIETSGGGSTEPDEPEHTHSYTESVTTEATCTTAGLKTFTCSCGDSYTEEIAATGHNYVDGTCSTCGDKETQSSVTESTVTVNIAGTTGTLASDSSSISWTSDSVTITNEKGSTAIRTSDSDHYRVYAGSTLKISSSEGKITKIVITCTSSSYATVMQTSATNAGYTATVSGSVVTVTGIDAESVNFTASAQTRAKAVEVTVEVPNGDSSCTHSYGEGVVTAPTCTEAGYTTYTCTLCEYSYKDNEVAATGHSYTDHVCSKCGADDPDHYFVMTIPEAVAAADGKKVQVSGTVCAINTAWSDSYGNISVTIKDADGNELYLYRLATNVALGDIITVKGAMGTYNSNRQIAAGATATIDGHDDSYDYTEMTIEEALAAVDNTNVIVTGSVISIDTEYSSSYNNISVTIADANGNKLYLYRLSGNVALHENITVKGTMATYNEARQISGGTFTSNGVEDCSEFTEATCTEPAKCVICGAENGEALGHDLVDVAGQAADCLNPGYTAYKDCSRCDHIEGKETIDALGHTDGEVVVENNVAPDCENAGSYDNVTYCTVCGVETGRDTVTVDATGHSYNAVVTAPTFGAQGYTTHTCSECGDNYVDSYVAAKTPAGKFSYRGYVNDSDDREAIAFDLENVAAGESVVIKVYDANGNLLTTTTLNAGGVEAASYTCNIVLWGRASSSWDTVISAEKLTVANIPATAELWCDGVLVDTYENALGAGTNVDEVPDYCALDCVYKEAQIGETYYATLQAAFNAAVSGDTITLVADVEASEYIDIYTANNGEVARELTLDLGGHTISPAEGYNYNTGYPLLFVGINQTLTLKGEGTIAAEKKVTVGVYGTIHIEGGKIVNNGNGEEDAALAIYYWNNDLPSYVGIVGGTGYVTGGQIDGVVYVDEPDADGEATLEISGGTFTTDVSDYLADGFDCKDNGDGTFGIVVHVHVWSDATCTEPQKCECGDTQGEALGHDFDDATCIAPKTCSVCGATEGEATGEHSYVDGVCSVCGDEITSGYMLYIYNGDGTVGMVINGSKSASEFSLKSALEDARVFANNGFLFGITGTPSLVVEFYEDSIEDESFEIGSDVTIKGNGHVIQATADITISGGAKLIDTGINANGANALTVSGLNFEGNSWINSGSAEELTVSGVSANVTPVNTSYTNSRSGFISLGRSEQQTLALTVENCNIVTSGDRTNPIIGWAAITEADIIGNTFGSESAYQTNSDSIKIMSIADGAVLNFSDNTVYSNYNGIVLGQNTTRDNSYTANFDGNTFLGGADHIWIEVSGSNTYNGNINASSDNTVNGEAFDANDIKLHPNLNTFTGYAGVDVVLNSEGKVIGGSMLFIAEDAIAEGYELDGNGNVVLKAPVYVAEINGVGYETLAEAAAAANSGDEIILIADAYIAEGTDVTIPDGVILNGNGFSIFASGADRDTTTSYGYIVAGGNLTIKGITKIEKFSASYYNHIITIGEGASLQVFGKNRVSLGYGSGFDVTGSITDAKNADKTQITPSLLISAGISIVGSNDTYLNVNNAYVVIGSSSSKNSNAGGKFDITFNNSIVEFTNQFTLSQPKYDTLNPVFNVTFKDSVVTTATKLCLMAPGSNVVVDNSDVTLGSYLHNSGELTVKNDSTFIGSMIQYGENGGNSGTITVDNSTFTIKNNNSAYAMDGNNTGKLIVKNGAVASVDYITETAIVLGVNSSLITKSENLTVEAEDGYKPVYEDGKYTLVEVHYAARINGVGYESFEEALAAASAMSGDVVVEILDKVTLSENISGSFDSITFVGKDTDAEIYLDVQGYITASGKTVNFEDLTLSKAAGGYITNAGFMNVAFGVYEVNEVNYTNCTFSNGSYASSGDVTYTDCTFYRSYDKYGLWAYGDADIVVDGCTFADYRGIKMYAEGAAQVTNLTVKNTDFSALDSKPAIVLTYGESVTLEGNTYSSTGTFELDLDGAPNGVLVNVPNYTTCKNDNGACGVIVDGKIYTTVAQAAEVATSGSTVTLLHDSTETVELAEGVILDKNGYTAAGITVRVPVYVAEVNGVKYETLAEALAAVSSDTDTVTILGDIEENLTGAYLRGNIVPADGVTPTITLTNDGWVYAPYTFVLEEGISLNIPNGGFFYYAGNAVINGDAEMLIYYQRYAGTKLYIEGSMTVTSETFILRYMDGDATAGIYVDGGTLNASVIYFYQGMLSATNGATINVGTYWQTNETDGEGSANLLLDNSNMTVSVSEHKMKATGNSTVSLNNGSTISLAGGYEGVAVSIDETSSMTHNGKSLFVAKIGNAYYLTLEDAVASITNDTVIKLLCDVEVSDLSVPDTASGSITFTADSPVIIKQTELGSDFDIVHSSITTIYVTENVTVEIYDNSSGVYMYYGPSLDLKGAIVGGQNWGVLYLFQGEHIVHENGKVEAGRVQIGYTQMTVYGNVNTNYLLVEGSTFIADGAVIDANVIYDNNNGGQRWGASIFTIKNGSVVTTSQLTLSYADSVLTIDSTSKLIAGTFVGEGSIVIDAAGFSGFAQIIDLSGSESLEGRVTINNLPEGVQAIYGADGDVYLCDANTSVLYVNPDYANLAYGTQVTISNPLARSGSASIVAYVGVNAFATIEEAVAAAEDGDTVTLVSNVTISDTIRISEDKNVVLDLNGKTVDGTGNVRIAIMSYGDLTIKDSSAEQTGIIKAGIGTAGNAINICGGSFTLESGSIYSLNNAILIDEEAATININGGKIIAEPTTRNSAAFYISSTSETVLNITDGEIVGYNGILLWNNNEVNISGGSIDAQGSAAIQGNGTKDNTEINISGDDTVIKGYYTAIYHPQGGDLNISGGTLSGWTGIVVKGGNVNISGGTINGTGAAGEYAPASSGFVDTGDALYVEHYDNSTNSENYGTPTVTITGGTFNSTNANAVGSYANTNNGVEALTGFIYGGTFNSNVSACLAAGYELIDNGDGTYTVAVDPAYGKVAKIGDNYYETLEDAIEAAVAGDVVEIIVDVIDFAENASSIVIDKAITIKGAGTSATTLNFNSATGAFAIQSSGVTFENMTITQGSKDNSFHIIISKGAWDAPAIKYSDITIKDIAFVGGDYALCLIGENVVVDSCSFTGQDSHNIIVYSVKGDSKIVNNVFNASNGSNKSAILYEGGADNATDLTGFIGGDTLTISGNEAYNKGVFFQFTNWTLVEDMNLVITNNKIDGTTNKAIALYDMDGAVASSGDEFASVVISENVFTNTKSGRPIIREYTGKVAINAFGNYLGSETPDFATLIVGDKITVKNYYTDEALTNLVEMVAKVGNNYYASLQAAVNAANEGNTILLLDDVLLTGKYVFDKAVVVDGQGLYSIIADANSVWYTVSGKLNIKSYKTHLIGINADNVTLKNITLDCNNNAAGINVYCAQNVVFENVSVINATKGYAGITVNGSTLTAKGSLTVLGNAVALDISNGSGVTSTLGLSVEDGTVLDLGNKTVKFASVATIDVEGAVNSEGKPYFVAMDNAYIYTEAQMNSRTTAYSNGLTLLADVELSVDLKLGNTLYLNGHTITFAEGKGLVCSKSGYMLVKDGDKYVLAKIVAKIGDNSFASISDAIDAAQAGDVITLVDDITLTEGVVIAADDEITLDLNGKTVSMTDSSSATAYAIKNNGMLTITDNSDAKDGKIIFTSTTPSASNGYASNTISNYGTITINGGVIENASVGGGACYALDNYAGSTATVNGGRLIAVKTAVRVFNWTNGDSAKTTLNVNGGEIISDLGYGINFNMGNAPVVEFNVTGGTITTNDTNYNLAVYIVNNGSAENLTVNVNGGTFDGNFALNGITSATMAEGAISITDGQFEGAICYGEPAYGFISGGRFNTKPEANLSVSGYAFAENADGSFGIVKAVASINGVGYASIDEALEAAIDGDTVTLLGDVTLDSILVLNKAITLDGANYILTSKANRAINVDCNGEVVIKNLTIVNGANVERAINLIQNAADLTLDNVVAEGFKYTVNVASSSVGSSITINGGKLSGYAAINITGSNTTVVVNDAELIGVNDAPLHESNNFGVIAVGSGNACSNISVTVNGGKITATSANGNKQHIVTCYGATSSYAYVDAELVLADGEVLYGEAEDIEAYFRADYADELAARGYLTNEAEDGMVVVAKRLPYYIGADGYWYLNGEKTEHKAVGTDGNSFTIGADGYWYLNGEKTEYKAVATDADQYTIGEDGYWYLNGVKTEYKAIGKDGQNYTIGSDGYWYLNGEKTEHKAIGTDGDKVEIGTDGYWYINGTKTEYKAVGEDGKTPTFKVEDGHLWASFDNTNWTDLGQVAGQDGAPGTDGKTPTLKVEGGHLWVSYDDGATWEDLGNVTGADGNDGNDGSNGINGKTPIFQIVEGVLQVSYDNGTTWAVVGNVAGANGADGINGKTPTFKIDENDGKLYVSYDEGNTWAEVGTVVGADGINGKTPTFKIDENDGKLYVSYDEGNTWAEVGTVVGEDGNDGKTPTLKVENGHLWVSYDDGATWEDLGNVTGADGNDGNDGSNGINGKTPTFKIDENDGKLYVSYDEGNTWAEVGTVVGTNGVDGINGKTPTFKIDENDGKLYVSYDEGNTWAEVGTVVGADGINGKTPTFKIDENDGKLYVSYDEGNTWAEIGTVVGADGMTPTISENGNWIIGGVETDLPAIGKDGKNYTIGEDGYWYCDGVKTDYRAVAVDGKTPTFKIEDGHLWVSYDDINWTDLGQIVGKDGITPHIGENGNWYIGDTDTGVKAEGLTPYIGENGNWFIGDKDTGISAVGRDGQDSGSANNEILILCIGIAALCIITTIVAVATSKSRYRWWILG